MQLEKEGFVLQIEDAWVRISNKYGTLEHGCVVGKDLTDGYAENLLDDFVWQHRVMKKSSPACIKKVAFDKESGEYIQLQAVLLAGKEDWLVQKYDNELVYMGEIWTGCRHLQEARDWMQEKFSVASGLMAGVYRDNRIGDCTNGGISANADGLCILSANKGPCEPEDIRQCVRVERRELYGGQNVHCRPVYFSKRRYMMGGNFLYTPDCRFREFAGSDYPIPIHDRYEAR